MRSQFAKQIGTLHSTDIKPHVLMIYRTLTSDNSKEIECAEIGSRVRLAIETNDPDLVVDLRPGSQGGQGIPSINLALIVEQVTAADERRHDVSPMREFNSFRNLISWVRNRSIPRPPNIILVSPI